ncbi:hypothetical protein H2200_007947 [Cladophialophora chaetospira]|uniref:Uncharacterized protein n=1 Tax=Cladophialophora chaetospira TaxID=386627 RepID=A0AA38X786_9EURO|nr:hypothetical protein H2200_007947 [Cladophialophora chaetospira]
MGLLLYSAISLFYHLEGYRAALGLNIGAGALTLITALLFCCTGLNRKIWLNYFFMMLWAASFSYLAYKTAVYSNAYYTESGSATGYLGGSAGAGGAEFLLWLGTTIYYTRRRESKVKPAVAERPPQTTQYIPPANSTPLPTFPSPAQPNWHPSPPGPGGDRIYEPTSTESGMSPGNVQSPSHYPGDTIYPASPVETMATPHRQSSERPGHGDRLFDD